MIKTMLFDLGNVLVFFSHDLMVEQIASVCGRPSDEVRRLLIDEGMQQRFERGLLTEWEFHQQLERYAGRTIDFAALRRAGADIFRRNDAIVPVLAALKDARFRLVLLSNTCVSHIEHVRAEFDCLTYFDDFVLSCEVGHVKPDPVIFAAALRRIECDPSECFYTDDIAEHVEAGTAAGLHARLFTDVDRLLDQLEEFDVPLDRGLRGSNDLPPGP